MSEKTSDHNKQIIYLLCLIGFFGIFSTTISKNPVLPLFAKSLGADTSLLGILSALSPLAGILFSFPVGFLADKLGKKKLLLVAAFIFTLAPLLYLLVTNPWWLLPVRFFHGLATAILGPIAAALIVSVYEHRRAEGLGLYSSSTLFGRMLAPLLGGFIIQYFAYWGHLANFRLVYLAAFLLSLPILIFTVLIPRQTAPAIRITGGFNIRSLILTLVDFGHSRPVFMTSLVQLITYFIYGVYETFLPLYLASKGIASAEIGLIFSLQVFSIALTQPFFGRLADRIDKRLQIVFGLLVLSLSAALFTVSGNFFVLVGIGLIFGLGMSFGTVATSARVAELSRQNELGSFLGALSSVMDIGQTAGPLVMGFVITALSLSTGFLVTAGLGLLVAVVYLISWS